MLLQLALAPLRGLLFVVTFPFFGIIVLVMALLEAADVLCRRLAKARLNLGIVAWWDEHFAVPIIKWGERKRMGL